MFNLNLLIVLFFLISCAGFKRNNVDLSQVRCEKSHYKRSLPLFTDKIMSSPEDYKPVYELSRCYYEALDFHRSLYYIDLVLKKEISVRSLNLKANSLFKIGRIDQSQQTFEQSLKLDPNHSFTLMNLGLVKFALGKFSDAENLWHKIKDENYFREPQYLLAIYRISVSKNDRESIIKNYHNLPDDLKDQFDCHLPFVQTIIAESSDADRLKFFHQLENSAGKKTENLVLLEKLKAQFPLSNSQN
jgi:tetratricopeptide (TPR) repeat protein